MAKPEKAASANGKQVGETESRLIDAVYDFVELLILTFAGVLVFTSLFLRHSMVDGSSMFSTLTDGEHLLISDLFYTPETGDIIVFENYRIDDEEAEAAKLSGRNAHSYRKALVKRVIATGGKYVTVLNGGYRVYVTDEKVIVDSTGRVCLDNETRDEVFPIEEPYVNAPASLPHYSEGSRINIPVPDGFIYVMGDNRSVSLDSRYFGCIEEDSVLGKLVLRIYPFERFGTVAVSD